MGSRSKVKLLRILFRFPDSEFTGEDLARKAGISKPRAHQALSELMEENLIARKVAGRAYLYRIVSDSFSARIVAPLFQASSSPLEELEKLVKKKLQPAPVVSAILYGSVVRGEEKPGSDIDLYLVVKGEKDRAGVQALALELGRSSSTYFGNRVSAMVKTVAESKHAYRNRRGLETQVEVEGRVLIGLPLREALK